MTEPRKRKLTNPINATLTALRDIKDTSGLIPPSPPSERMDGKVCLVTGANAGLGTAIARDLAMRGATLILAGRSGIPETGEALSAETGNQNISMERVDLSDLASIDALVARLAKAGTPIDRLILNAGLMAQKAKRSAQGFELMFAVHLLGNQRLATGLVEAGIIQKHTGARIIAVSSEAHRSAPPLDMETFGQFKPHGVSGAMKQYGHSKLALSLMIRQLAKNLTDAEGKPEIGVFHMCPGPINSSIARDAPALIRGPVKAMMNAFFPSPEKAARPVIHLACSPSLDGKSGDYMHLMRFKDPSDIAMSDAKAEAVFAYGLAQFETYESEQADG